MAGFCTRRLQRSTLTYSQTHVFFVSQQQQYKQPSAPMIQGGTSQHTGWTDGRMDGWHTHVAVSSDVRCSTQVFILLFALLAAAVNAKGEGVARVKSHLSCWCRLRLRWITRAFISADSWTFASCFQAGRSIQSISLFHT